MVRRCKSQKSLVGKTIIVTGANSGIGFETALEFAKRGGRIILACRNKERGQGAVDKIIDITGNKNIIFKKLDLESLQSVRDFANDFINTEERLDILVNNAGSGYLPNQLTDDGLQLQMQINHFGPFLLTNLLLDLLKKSAPSRIVNVSSLLAKFSPKVTEDNLNEWPGEHYMYPKTKLCNILFTMELAKRLQGTEVTTYSLHPGAVNTEFQRFSKFFTFISNIMFRSAEEGAQTSIYCALEEGIEEYSGRHFDDCEVVSPYCNAKDSELAARIWEKSEILVGLKSE